VVVQGYSGYRNRYQSKAHKRLPCLLSFPVGQKLVENLRFSQFGFKLSSDFKLSQGGRGCSPAPRARHLVSVRKYWSEGVENSAISKCNFGVEWPWPLTAWPQKSTFHRLGPLEPIFSKIGSFGFKILCSRDWWRMNGRTDTALRNIMTTAMQSKLTTTLRNKNTGPTAWQCVQLVRHVLCRALHCLFQWPFL